MYGKLFEQMYKGSMIAAGWEALIVMQQLVILADRHGEVEMTPQAISNTTTIPLDIVEKGLQVLMEPDPMSRSKAEEGRRIVLLDPDRPWGWRLVNYQYYVELASKEDKRRKDAERLAEKRNENNNSQDVAKCRSMSQSVADSRSVSQNVAHVDVDIDINKKKGRFTPPSLSEVEDYCQERENGIDAEAFLNHYDANGWMRGKTKIKDWKACVRTWEKRTPKEDIQYD